MLVPYEIETLLDERPYANWALIAITSAVSLLALAVVSDDGEPAWVEALVLDGWNPIGLLGHTLLHGGFMHLAGNMLFLYVFGNAVCSNAGPRFYLSAYLGCTLIAASVHNIFSGVPAVGASGAINGVVGITLAAFPLNRISIFWFFVVRWGTFQVRVWHAVVYWLIFDVYGAISGGDDIAYWAHIGGLLGGTAIGLLALHTGWISLTEWDNRSLLEIFKRDSGEQRKEGAKFARLLLEQEEE